jgi:hypothetical protein
MANGLNISRLVNVQVNLSAQAAATRSFGAGLAVSRTNIINVGERLRGYTDTTEIAQDFGSTSPEYLAGVRYFSQLPRPGLFYIGRWAESATQGFLIGGDLTPEQQNILLFNSISDGAFDVVIDGSARQVTDIDLRGVTNLNEVVSRINLATADGVISWDGEKFVFESPNTGSTSSVGFFTPPATGTDIGVLLRLTATTAAYQVPGINAESPLDAVVALADKSSSWYAMGFALTTSLSDSDIVSIAEYIESLQVKRTYWLITQDPNTKNASISTDIGSILKSGGYKRTFVQYSEFSNQSNFVDVFSAMARLITTDFTANNSMITLMYKQEPTVTPLILTTSEANALQGKNVNAFVAYDNDTAIIQYGTMSGEVYADEIIGLDWFSDAIQTACYNALYTSTTKVPQTDAGQNILVNACSSVCDQAVNNGFIAAGQWNGSPFGQLSTGDFLPSGFYIYSPPMAAQAQSVREQRISQTIQIAIKLAGAIHEVNVIVNVNR